MFVVDNECVKETLCRVAGDCPYKWNKQKEKQQNQ